MAFRIVWSESALDDLRALIRYIARDDRHVARRFGDMIVNKVQALQTFPRIGRVVPEYRKKRIRELILSPYRIVYEIDDHTSQLSVLRIWHSARGNLELGSWCQISVSEIAVSTGQEAKAGDKLVVLEAMKMLTTVSASADGTIAEVLVKKGEQVDSDDLSVKVETA